MRQVLFLAATLQVAATVYCIVLLRQHRIAASAWGCLLGVMLSMLTWRIVVATGATPNIFFTTFIAMWGSVCAVLAMFLFAREVTRRQQAESERDRLLTSERNARADAERASRIKDEFMATLSHELRSPLAAMLGWCALAKSTPLSAEARRAVDTIERNAHVQTRLVDDLLDATRMQSGSLHLELSPVSLEVPVRAAIDSCRPSAELKGIALEFSCTAPPTALVVADASRMQQIASNLIANAVKFSPERTTVRISVSATPTHTELSVKDEGIGIDAAFIPQLFQRFRQADTGNARRHGGLGLGLSIASSLVQLHGGQIHAESDGQGRGATFRVRLPIAHMLTARETEPIPSSPLPSVEGVRVIVVDDELDVREAVSGLLQRAGAQVLALESGATIERALIDFRPDVLILDISMPGEDGYTLLQRIRRLNGAAGAKTPAISLTAHARKEDRAHAIQMGFADHLPKPISLPTLIRSISALGRQNPNLITHSA
jgi:signal transduction histidine kinase/ActR/RegA family two-component response regulator